MGRPVGGDDELGGLPLEGGALLEAETGSVEDEVWEPILYLPAKPSVATLFDGLIVQSDSDGLWQSPRGWG